MPTVSDVLASKGLCRVHSIAPSASVLDAVEKMNQLKIACLLVMEEGQIAGIFTERDVLQRVVGQMLRPADTMLAEVMTRDVVCVEPETDLDDVSTLMKERRVRHLPVCDNNRVIGMVSIGDVNAMHASNQQAALHYLNEYVYGRV
jgi:CBS domain-containing protein